MQRRSVLQAAVALLLAAAVVWSLLRHGATPLSAQYALFLVLLVAGLLAFLGLRLEILAGRAWALLVLVGLPILGQVALRSTLAGRGFVHLGIGWLGLVLALWLGSSSRRVVQALLVLLMVVGLLESGFALLELRGVVSAIARHPEIQGHLAIGTLINPNHFAGLVNMSLTLTLGGLVVTVSGMRSGSFASRLLVAATLVAGAALMSVAIHRAESRGATIALGAAVAWMVGLVALRRAPALRAGLGTARGIFAAGLLGLAVVVGLAFSVDRSGVLSLQHRGEIYRDTTTMIGDRPLLGVGPGMYQWRFRPYQTVNLKGHYHHAHNDYLQTAAEWGIPMALLFWGFLAWRLHGSARVWLDSPQSWSRALALGSSGAIVSILVHSLVDFNLQIPGILLIFAIVVGSAWSLERGSPMGFAVAVAAVPVSGARRLLTRIVVPVFFVVAGLAAARQLAALECAGPVADVDRLEQALRLDPRNPEHHFILGLAYRDDLRRQDLEAALEHLERAVSLNPWAWGFRRELARLYQLQGRTDDAVSALRQALKLNPRAASYHWELANALLLKGDLEGALPSFRSALAERAGYRRAAVALLLSSGATRRQIDLVWPDGPAETRELERLLERERRSRRRRSAAGEN